MNYRPLRFQAAFERCIERNRNPDWHDSCCVLLSLTAISGLYRTMERRINAIQANGTDAEIEVFHGLSHGFGLGTGTVAEGWIDRAVAFWERNMKNE